jgi:hypothetical protein
LNNISISPLNVRELESFFSEFDFEEDSVHIKQYVSLIKELAFCQQVIIYEGHDLMREESFGFFALKTTHDDIDNVPGIIVEFLYLKSEYRSKIEEFSGIKYSFLLLDYVINVAIDIQKLVAINHVYLVPISDKMRTIYNEYGFVNIPGSGKNEYEDYMVFNLLDEDPTLL